MVLTETPICEFGLSAPDFSLQGVDDKTWSLQDCVAEKGLLVMFICNHCPYVKAIIDRLNDDCKQLQQAKIGVVAIMSNDPSDYPEDSFENMKKIAQTKQFSFPYLLDATQNIAKAYDAVCTPDFFGYNNKLELQYRGRLDAGVLDTPPADTPRELLEAMLEVAKTGRGPEVQTPSMGCSIKWTH